MSRPAAAPMRAGSAWRLPRGFDTLAGKGKMMTRRIRNGTTAAFLLAGACATQPVAKPVQLAPVQPPHPPTYNVTGLETVIGRTAGYLTGEFGKPDLDIREGTARKLQFSGPACVLDAYLYPPQGGSEPIVTYIDARAPGGGDFDRASCVAALVSKTKP
jgi:hypothetical protein